LEVPKLAIKMTLKNLLHHQVVILIQAVLPHQVVIQIQVVLHQIQTVKKKNKDNNKKNLHHPHHHHHHLQVAMMKIDLQPTN